MNDEILLPSHQARIHTIEKAARKVPPKRQQ